MLNLLIKEQLKDARAMSTATQSSIEEYIDVLEKVVMSLVSQIVEGIELDDIHSMEIGKNLAGKTIDNIKIPEDLGGITGLVLKGENGQVIQAVFPKRDA